MILHHTIAHHIARVVTLSNKNISPILKSEFTGFLSFGLHKIRQSGELWYLRTLLTEYVATRNLRAAERKDHVITRVKLVIASRAFSVAAPPPLKLITT